MLQQAKLQLCVAKSAKKKMRQLTIPDSTTPHREKNANHEKRGGKVFV